MSTSGKFGERQSWRRAGSGEAGKRRTLKALLTVVAVLLTLMFLYIVFYRRPDNQLVTILVSNEYDMNVVTPPMFAENAYQALRERLGVVDEDALRGDSNFIRSSFQDVDTVEKYLDDPDDTVMVVVRGYLMLDGQDRVAIACSDLAIGPTPSEPKGLLPLSEILEPLSAGSSSSFQGSRLVVLDIEPLAAHAGLGQWNDQVFAKLDDTLKELSGPLAEHLWVLVTRGPMQNVGWDHTTKMPLSTQTLLEGLDGQADLNRDFKINLGELCAFISDRYERLPRDQKTESPRLMLLQGKTGIVDSKAVAGGDLDVWVSRAEPPPEADEEQSAEESPDEPAEMADDVAEKISDNRSDTMQITPVVLQSTGTSAASAEENVSTVGSTAAVDANPADASGDSSDGNSPGTAPAADVNRAADVKNANTAKQGAANATNATTFWDLRDAFESIPLASSGGEPAVSPVALAPHLWRQLLVRALGGEVKNFDPSSPTATANQVAQDLSQLQANLRGRTLAGSRRPGNINDDIVLKLDGIVVEHWRKRRSLRSDRRLQRADALQHAVAVARSRLWSYLEFQRQAAVCGAQVPPQDLYADMMDGERVLESGSGTLTPDQGTIDRQLDSLHRAIELFDRNVEGAVTQLLKDLALSDPPRTWELTRQAWAWLRSPLPTGQQRRSLMAAIETAPLDETDIIEREIDFNTIVFAEPKASQQSSQLTADYRSGLTQYELPPVIGEDTRDSAAWRKILEQGRDQPAAFSDAFAAALRVDPRIKVEPVEPVPIVHSIEPLPVKRNPNVAILDAQGEPLGDSGILRLETMQDVQRITLRIDPDRDRPTRLLVSFHVRSASNGFGSPPIDVTWKVPGATERGAGEPLTITIDGDAPPRDLPLEVRPRGLAESGEGLVLEVQIRGDRPSDEIENVVGVRSLRIELPRENRLRLVASSYRGIGCSKEILSNDGGLPGGLWLRTFNDRETPFQLELFNESGKACLAKVWLIKLPNPLPDVAGYWPDFAANAYSNPEGGILDAEGRIQDRYLREDRVLKGPGTMSIPADQKRVALDFSPPPPPEGATPAPPPPPAAADAAEVDVSHGMALVCRLVDQQGNIMPENDQLIYLVAKPWAPKDYVSAKVNYIDGEVEVNLELVDKIDGDAIRDEIPNIEKDAVDIRWVQDDQWAVFPGQTTQAPDDRGKGLKNQAGQASGYFRVPVVRRRPESWVRLDVDGWPRAIQQVVAHQSGSFGEPKFKNEIRFGSIELTKRPVGNQTPPATLYFWPEKDVFFKGNGEELVATIRADFAVGVFNRFSNPEVTLEVEGNPYATYRTDRLIKTIATKLTNDGVITLSTSVSDLQARLNQGQRSDDRIPIQAILNVRNQEQDAASITAVLDSTPPETIAIRPRRFGPYEGPAELGFSITASDSRRDAAGISTIEYGLDTKNDGQADTQRKTQVFDPPVGNAIVPTSESVFKFAVAGDYGIVVRAIDASGNESIDKYDIRFQKAKPPMAEEENAKAAKAKVGRIHGVINTRANLYGTLSLSPTPDGVNRKEEEISGTDKSFDFGPLPESKYTLTFKGFKNGQSIDPLIWKELEIDPSPNKSKTLALDLNDAESESE